MEIDLNCDMGESYGAYTFGNDAAIFPHITSCNIACGFHAGDPLHIEKAIRLALLHGVRIGAHPSYPDRQGFGRRYMKMEKAELKACLKYQIAALKGMVESQGGTVAYVKPHGALYNQAAKDKEEAMAVLEAVREMGENLAIMGLPNSTIHQLCLQENAPFISEAFADRRYEQDGALVARSKPGSVIEEPKPAADQLLGIYLHRQATSLDGQPVQIHADSFCIHGDNPMAVAILQEIDCRLAFHNLVKRPLRP